jgi:hypothetical protein
MRAFPTTQLALALVALEELAISLLAVLVHLVQEHHLALVEGVLVIEVLALVLQE